jgi:type VI protein secretion system component VasF
VTTNEGEKIRFLMDALQWLLVRLAALPALHTNTAALQLWNGEIGRIKQMQTKAERQRYDYGTVR